MSGSPALPERDLPPVADLHCDTIAEVQGGADLGCGNPEGHVDIPRLRQGGVALQVFACFISSLLPEGRAFAETLALLDQIDAACRRFADDLLRVDSAADVVAALRLGRIGAMAAVENGHAIEGDLGKLETLRRRGVRYLTLTHARHLAWAAASGEPWDGQEGLTALGAEVVREMNALGMIVDVSHVHERTFWDVVRLSRKPFIASHSAAAALCPLGRNLTDDQLRALAGAGGMVGINFYPGFLDPAYFAERGTSLDRLFADLERIERDFMDDPARKVAESHRAARQSRELHGPPRADLDTVVAHVEHVVNVVGDDHVGFGSDFDGVPDLPGGLPDCAAFPRILARLRERGFSAASLRKIAWENFLRVIEANEV